MELAQAKQDKDDVEAISNTPDETETRDKVVVDEPAQNADTTEVGSTAVKTDPEAEDDENAMAEPQPASTGLKVTDCA